MKTNFTKRLLGACRQVVLACIMVSAIGIYDAAAQTCTVKSNTVLDVDCEALIMADALVTGTSNNVFHSVTLDGGANLVSSGDASVTISAPGTYTYQITDASGCWGTFNVEDKAGPVCSNDGQDDDATNDCYFADGATCEDGPLVSTCGTAVHQFNADNYLADRVLVRKINDPSARLTDDWAVLEANDFEDCTGIDGAPWSVDSEYKNCDIESLTNAELAAALGVPIYSVTQAMNLAVPPSSDDADGDDEAWELCSASARSWYAKDIDGNVSEQSVSCTQVMLVYRPTFDHIQISTYEEAACNEDVSDIGPFFLNCGDVDEKVFLSNLDHSTSKFIVTKEEGDQLPTCGKGYKQINNWTVIDWCDTDNLLTGTQLVEVKDEIAPTTPAGGTASFQSDAFDCAGTITVGAAISTDKCDETISDWITTVSYETTPDHGGVSTPVTKSMNTNGGSFINIPIGVVATVSWVAIDDCGNRSVELTTTVESVDNRGPVAICNDELNVSLVAANNAQQARVYAEDLDDTSRDNCGITKKEVSLDGVTYADYVTLGCADLGTTVVYLRVTDAAGNSNVCWTDITVEDKTVPVVIPPADQAINCLEEIPAVGTPTIVSQGCVAPGIEYKGEDNVGISCGNDVITRTWTVTPPSNGAHAGSDPYDITQKITIAPAEADWTATFPADDLTLKCDGMNTIPAQLKLEDILVDNSCNDWLLRVEDKDYSAGGDVCRKVVRTYTLINWCTVVNPGKPAAIVTDQSVDQDDDGDVPGGTENLHTYGIFSYTQVFKISDSEVPTADISATPDCEIADDCFGGKVDVTVSNAADNCGTATITSISISGEGVNRSDDTPEDGLASFTGLASGSYTVSATIVDACNNQKLITTSATVQGDCKKPTPIGVPVFTALMESDMVDVWVSDVEKSSYDNCTTRENLKYAVELLEDTNNDGQFSAEDASATMPTSQSFTLTCDKINTSMIALWAMDEAGNTQVSLIPVGVTDNDNSCNAGAAAAIAGKITNENNEDIDQVMVKFESAGQSLAEQLFSGSFNYSVPMHTDLTITPEKDQGYDNGISTADLVKLQRHILGISSLSSAYQMIAADVNSDNKVSTTDMLHISRLILGLYDELPNSTSWKFVAKDYNFANPSSPWGFPQALNYADLDENVQADFVGIKIGDLTGNASPINLMGDDNVFVGEMKIAIDDQLLAAGQSTVVDFKASDFTDFAGFQFTISLGADVKLLGVTPGVLPNMTEANNFGLNRVSEGRITTAWSNANGISLDNDEVLFSLILESADVVNLSEVLNITSDQTTAEAYNNDLDVHSVGVQFNRIEDAAFQLFQNQPNPFRGETMISFNMPKTGVATLKVMNVAGQVLTTRSAEFVKGYNQISLSKSELNTSGVLYYQIDTENHSATKKMVILE